MNRSETTLSAEALAVAQRVESLRDFLGLLGEHGQCITWPEPINPEPDIRNIAAAAGRDEMSGPAVLFDRIRGYPGQRLVLGVHGSFSNIALLLGHPRGTTIKQLFYEIAGRWGSDRPLIERVAPREAPVNQNRAESGINLYDLLPLYRTNAMDGGFYIAKANIVSRDPRAPEDFNRQNVGIYRTSSK